MFISLGSLSVIFFPAIGIFFNLSSLNLDLYFLALRVLKQFRLFALVVTVWTAFARRRVHQGIELVFGRFEHG